MCYDWHLKRLYRGTIVHEQIYIARALGCTSIDDARSSKKQFRVQTSALQIKQRWGRKKIWDGVGFVKFVLSPFVVMGLTCPAAIVTLFLSELTSLYQGKLEAFILNATVMITFVAFGSLNLSQRRLLKQANTNNFKTLMTSQADWALLTSKSYFICPRFSIAYRFHFRLNF